jgi:hypothetical protein
VTVSLVETPKTAKAKGGVLFSEMAGPLAGRGTANARASLRFLTPRLSFGLAMLRRQLSPQAPNIAVIAMHNCIAALR